MGSARIAIVSIVPLQGRCEDGAPWLPTRVRSAGYARAAGASAHAVRIIRAAENLSRQGETYERLSANYATLGYRGHPITKSRGCAVTFGQLRRSRRLFHSKPAALAPDADVRMVLDADDDIPEGFEVISSFQYVGTGYLDFDQAAAAVRSAAMARIV